MKLSLAVFGCRCVACVGGGFDLQSSLTLLSVVHGVIAWQRSEEVIVTHTCVTDGFRGPRDGARVFPTSFVARTRLNTAWSNVMISYAHDDRIHVATG